MGCDDVCSEHSGLETSIKWITKFLFVGFTAVLSAVTYFNVTLQDTVAEMNTNVAALNYTISERSQAHEYSLEKLVGRVDAMEVLCCEVN